LDLETILENVYILSALDPGKQGLKPFGMTDVTEVGGAFSA